MPPMDGEEIAITAFFAIFVLVLFGLALADSKKPTCDQGFVRVKSMCVQGYDPRKPR